MSTLVRDAYEFSDEPIVGWRLVVVWMGLLIGSWSLFTLLVYGLMNGAVWLVRSLA